MAQRHKSLFAALFFATKRPLAWYPATDGLDWKPNLKVRAA
jgi:hypothetical protein